CIAGALREDEYRAKLVRAGFIAVDIEPTRVYDVEAARAFLSREGVDIDAIAPQVEGKLVSAFIRATKPDGCCAPGCCSRQ
ncbi:MAG TPA: hypothetical protein VN633_19625, partial [Bryobacteraceae bacterium]|nr:hypothetical protein [Bryobacteraceae bacterium]